MKETYEELRDDALVKLKTCMDSLDTGRGKKLAYWIRDYTRFLCKEHGFDCKKLIRYKRGAIVKAHLGYRIGSEEGGLHYAVVIDVNNSPHIPTATIIPLTSVKAGVNVNALYPADAYLGDEVYIALRDKLQKHIAETSESQETLFKRFNEIEAEEIDPSAFDAEKKLQAKMIAQDGIRREVQNIGTAIHQCEKMLSEIKKMKCGSIALVGQITTISKIRIYDPLYPPDTLANIRLSDDSMDKLDEKIISLFTRKI